MVDIVIPIYKEVPGELDVIAIRRAFAVLGRYNINFVCPKNFDTSQYQDFGKANFVRFDDRYFRSIAGYNALLLSVDFYRKFDKEYLLIYQTDAFVFSDDLEAWCRKGYDYVGAPWLRSHEKIPAAKLFWDRALYRLKTLINYKNNGRYQKDKSLLYNAVGNGGLSLRRREKFIEVLEKLPDAVEVYLAPRNQSAFYAEDVFFSIEPRRNGILFNTPSYREACLFAIENKQDRALEYTGGKLPFGCHRWDKELQFWRTNHLFAHFFTK